MRETKEQIIIFDDMCRKQIAKWIESMNDMCLKEREGRWMNIYGFVQTHLEWYESLKEKGK